MSNLAIFMPLERHEILTQKQILLRSTRPKTRRWNNRQTFLSKLCRTVLSLEEKQYYANLRRQEGIEPPGFKSGRGCHYLVGDLLDAIDNNPFQIAENELMEYLSHTIASLIAAAPSCGLTFDLNNKDDRKLWHAYVSFIYLASEEDLRKGLEALKYNQSHILANRIRGLPREVLIGICDHWLPYDPERVHPPLEVSTQIITPPEPESEEPSMDKAEVVGFPIGKLRLWSLAAICLCFIGLGLAQYFASPHQVYQTIGRDGPEVARTLETDPDDADALYANAYADYRAGRFAEAKLGVFSVLAINGADKKREANCIYLLGMIATVAGAPEEGLELAEVAEVMYEDLGSDLGVYNTHLEKARAYWLLEDHEAAQAALLDAREYYDRSDVAEKKAYLPLWYSLSFQVSLALGDAELALELANERLYLLPLDAEFEKGTVLSELGIALTISGQLEHARKVLDHAAEHLDNSPSGLKYLQAIEVLLKRAKGEPYQEIYDDVLDYARANDLPDLIYTLEKALSWPIEVQQ